MEGANFPLFELANLKYQILGIDSTVSASLVRRIRCINPNLIIQGNFDPAALHGSREDIIRKTHKMIDEYGPNKYIVNVGHDIYSDVSVDAIEAFIDAVRSYRRN